VEHQKGTQKQGCDYRLARICCFDKFAPSHPNTMVHVEVS
jgi:hypothetical protein